MNTGPNAVRPSLVAKRRSPVVHARPGRARSVRLRCRPPGALSRSVGQGSGKAEPWQDAGFEAGDGADLVAGEAQHEQAVRVGDRGVGVAQVQAERGLSVGPGGDQAEPAAVEGPREEPGGELASLASYRASGPGARSASPSSRTSG